MKTPLALFFCISMVSALAERPLNYLIVLADDISATDIGCYGSKNPKTTPHIDKLAKEGIKFTNMFVSEAICAPARAELYTGLQPHRNGVFRNHMKTNTGTQSIVHYLNKLGYRVGLTGKLHASPRSVYPFQDVKGLVPNCNARAPITEKWEGIKEFVTSDREEPFCLVLGSIHAHAPWDAGDTSHWELNELVLPPNLANTKETRHYFREYLAEVRLFDDQVGKAVAMLKELGLEKNTVLIVLDENGAAMPGGKWTTYDWGVRSACIMKWPDAYQATFETDAIAQYCDLVPTLIDAAGGEVPANLDGKSLLPLVKKEATKHRDQAFFIYNSGSEGLPFSSRAVTDGRYKLIWNLAPGTPYAVRTINGFDYGYVDKMEDRHVRQMYLSWLEAAKTDPKAEALITRFRKRPEFQLYDLDQDRNELSNLARDPEHASRIASLKQEIMSWMDQQGDDGDLHQSETKQGGKRKKARKGK